MQRGELWWVQFPQPVGRRPALLLSRNRAYVARESATLAPVTRRIRGIRSEVSVGPEEGLPQQSVVNLDDITTVGKHLVTERIGTLSEAKMSVVARAIRYALDLP